MSNTDFKVLKKKEIDKNTILKVTKNIMSGRLFVEFTTENPNIVLQKNFPDTVFGRMESEKFAKSITSTDELKAYFGIKTDNKGEKK